MGRLKKAEYIEKYGEEAWKEFLEKAKIWNKKSHEKNKETHNQKQREYYSINKETILERQKEYSQKNAEKISEYQKEYRTKNKEELAEKRKQRYKDKKEVYSQRDKEYRLKNKEKLRNKNSEYRKLHKQELIEYQKRLRETELGRARDILHSYKQRDKQNEVGECTITDEWIVDNIFTSRCIYCGDNNWRHLGCDRIDNEKAHTTDNCVCACGICNIERQHKKMSVEKFTEFRKTHPRGWDRIENIKSEIVEVGGVKVLRKKVG